MANTPHVYGTDRVRAWVIGFPGKAVLSGCRVDKRQNATKVTAKCHETLAAKRKIRSLLLTVARLLLDPSSNERYANLGLQVARHSNTKFSRTLRIVACTFVQGNSLSSGSRNDYMFRKSTPTALAIIQGSR